MSQAYEFLKECGVFFISTINNGAPATRPFGAVMEHEGELYFSTAKTKNVFEQLIHNPSVQIIALKAGTGDWIRIDGKAVEVHDFDIKQKMLEVCPVLQKRFAANTCEYFALFKVTKAVSALNTNGKFANIK